MTTNVGNEVQREKGMENLLSSNLLSSFLASLWMNLPFPLR